MPEPQHTARSYANLQAGDPAPWFHGRTATNPNYAFDTAAGRYIVMCFFLTAADAVAKQALKTANAHAQLFDDKRFCFFGISIDPRDEAEKRVEDRIPGFRHLFDFSGDLCRTYGASPRDSKPGDTNVPARRFWLVLDPTLRVLKQVEFGKDTSNAEALFSFLERLPPPEHYAGIELQAPVLLLPNVFEPEFCKHLIGLYEKHGGEESGFMREVNGKTMLLTDPKHKRRKDYIIEDEALMNQTRERIRRRVAPEIRKVHQFAVTRMERFIVSCYAAEDQAHFGAHRDNTTKGTAHRRFAVSINLNAEFDGGRINFPEYGPRSFKPPPGGACVFSCSLLHAVSEVTSGRRFAFLPFLYDDEAAKVREANNQFLGDGIGAYQQT